jgi:hypothetical protein
LARWTSFAAKVALAAGSCVVALGGAAAIAMYWHVQARFVTVDAAAAELANARASASVVSTRPMLEVSGQLQVLVHRDPGRERHGFAALHWVDYDPSARKLVRADIPEWLLRIVSADGRIRLANLDIIQRDNERITLEDLERHGPGVILDVDVPQGRQVIVWIE